MRCVPERRENELRAQRGEREQLRAAVWKGNWGSIEGSGAPKQRCPQSQLPTGPLLEGKTEMKVKSWTRIH